MLKRTYETAVLLVKLVEVMEDYTDEQIWEKTNNAICLRTIKRFRKFHTKWPKFKTILIIAEAVDYQLTLEPKYVNKRD